jgi:hypothetical protein
MTSLKQKIALGLMALFSTTLFMLALVLRLKDPRDPGRADFMGFYVAGRILNEGPRPQLYNTALQLSLRERLFGPAMPVDVYLHPPFEALLFSPLARLPYPVAYILWDLANLLMLAACVYLLRPFALHLNTESRLLLTLAMLYPLISTFGEGQDSIMLLLLYVLAFINLKKGRDIWAGCALGASLFRFPLAIPLLLVFVVRKRWRVVLSASILGALLGAVSLALLGWTGIRTYAHLLLTLTGATYTAAPQMPTVRGFLDTLLASRVPERPLSLLVALSSLALLAWLLQKWRNRSWNPAGRSFDLLFSLSLVVAFMLSFHSLIHTLMVLALPVLLLLDDWAASRKTGIRRWLTVAPLILLIVTAVLVNEMTVNSFTYLFPSILLFAFAISAEISRLDDTALSQA